MTSPDGLWKESNNFWQNASHHHSMKKNCPNPLCVLAVELIYVFMFTRLRTARFPLLKCEKNRQSRKISCHVVSKVFMCLSAPVGQVTQHYKCHAWSGDTCFSYECSSVRMSCHWSPLMLEGCGGSVNTISPLSKGERLLCFSFWGLELNCA